MREQWYVDLDRESLLRFSIKGVGCWFGIVKKT